MKKTGLLIKMLVILSLFASVSSCLTESSNHYNLTHAESNMEGGADMGKINNVSEAYAHAKFVGNS